jgi:hypothetical protein
MFPERLGLSFTVQGNFTSSFRAERGRSAYPMAEIDANKLYCCVMFQNNTMPIFPFCLAIIWYRKFYA